LITFQNKTVECDTVAPVGYYLINWLVAYREVLSLPIYMVFIIHCTFLINNTTYMSIVYKTTVVTGTFITILTIVVIPNIYFIRYSDSYKNIQYIQLNDCQSCQRLSLYLALTN